MDLADVIGKDYLKLGVYLDLQLHIIETIGANHGDVVTRAFYVLVAWRRESKKQNSMTTFRELCSALTKLEQTALVKMVTRGE